MLYCKQSKGISALSYDKTTTVTAITSTLGTVRAGSVYKRFGYCTLALELILQSPVAKWDTVILKLPADFLPYIGTYTTNHEAFIHVTGEVRSNIDLKVGETFVIYTTYLAASY